MRKLFIPLIFALLSESLMASEAYKDLETQVTEKASLAVAQMNDRAAGKLDYSEESLYAVEEMAAEAAQYKDQLDPATVDSLTQLLGSYILEVAHRKHGGSYVWLESENSPALVVGEPEYRLALSTFAKVHGRLSGDEADNLIFFYQGFSERLKSPSPGMSALYK
ncbi:hypothetical protein [Aquipseudomonas alcaligenes]|uniref:hypothetical protein n=1 Tax=Aquipseudomonas alcaligenes TaxID=43263 RepID=UPI00142FF117|nr:hypothetical protein [Pseudomonas alcaligenes]